MENICKYKYENLKFSEHSKTRYAERIMDRNSKSDVAVYVAQNEQKIKEDIYKMIQYGELIYSGKSAHEFNKQPVDIFLNGTWVVIVDVAKLNVVTLYSIDLGVGNDFNQEYIGMLTEKLNKAKETYNDICTGIKTQIETYSSIIKENTNQINEYKQIINNLQKQNQAYTDVIDSLEVDKTLAEKDVRDIIATMIGKKIF